MTNKSEARSFLRWAGGKQKLAKILLRFCPPKDLFQCYYEPFLGGGAVFFHLNPSKAIIGDHISELVNCYQQIRDDVDTVWVKLYRYKKQDSPKFYYRIRSRSTKTMSATGRAARFIYLNKAAFNGIYRVNSAGEFNVPYGPSKNGPAIPSHENLRRAAKSLSSSIILHDDFENILTTAKAGDFIYLDPPYPPKSITAFFNHYTSDRFTWADQERVAEIFMKLSQKGCYLMLSNSDQEKVLALYSDYMICRLNVIRWIGSNGDRSKVQEIVVTNYDPNTIKG